jgi:5-methylthioadenosine/S-adenosylhomocysteine deaminase
MADTLLENGTIVTVNGDRDILEHHSILIRDDRIHDIGPVDDLKRKYASSARIIDMSAKVVFPGLINTHNHLFQTLLKGLGDDLVLSDWLSSMTFPSGVHLEGEHTYAAASLGCLEGIQSGTTTMVDYMYPHPRAGLDEGVLQGMKRMGVRGIFGRGMMDTGEKYGTPKGIMQQLPEIEKELVHLFDTYHNSENGRIHIGITPAAVWSNTEETMRRTWEIAQHYKALYSVHISETPFDREACTDLHGVSDAEALEKFGILGPEVLMVHCVYLTDRDIRMAKYHDLKVSHNPVSNMYLSSGVARIPRMLESGITVGLGTDGPASNNSQDMVELLKFTALLQKVHSLDPTIISADKVLEMATIDGARAIGMDKEIGSIEKGKKADLFVYNPFRTAKSVPNHNPVSTLVYSGTHASVETVFIDGVVVLEDGKLTIDSEEKIIADGQEAAEDLAKKTGTITNKYRRWRTIAF